MHLYMPLYSVLLGISAFSVVYASEVIQFLSIATKDFQLTKLT